MSLFTCQLASVKMLNRMKHINSDQEAKFIQDRISSVERNFAELCFAFGAYSRKAARVRDKGDDLSNTILHLSEVEDVNKSLSNSLAKCASLISTVNDYGDKRVQYIDNKVVNELAQYETICKRAKDEVKQIFIARDKEVLRKRQLDRIRERNPRNRQQIVQAETDLVHAAGEVARTMHNLEESTTTFERQKLHDIKAILLEFITTEIGFHAKALENMSNAYKVIYSIDENSDLEAYQNVIGEMEMEFKKSLRLPESIPHQPTRRSLFRTGNNLGGSLGSIFSTPKKRGEGIPVTIEASLKKRQAKSEDELDKPEEKSALYGSAKDTDETDSNDEDSDNESTDKSEKSDKTPVSPFIAKRFLK